MDTFPLYTVYTNGPITEEDNIISVSGLGSTASDMIIVEDYEEKVSTLKNGLLPDPRIMIPQTQTMDIFDSDIFICAFMKAGTHWVWEMCQMLIKGKPEYHHKSKESCMLEFHLADEFKTIKKPRIFNTHMTPKCLPQKILDKKCKIIYLQRNPKDIITSTYHHMKQTTLSLDPSTTWSHFLSEYIFKNDRDVHSNWFYYTKTWLEFIKVNNNRVLILQYEDIKKNTEHCLQKLAEYIGYERDVTLYMKIKEMCSVNKMKTMENDRETDTVAIKPHQVSSLYRKGVIGDWKNQFTVAQSEQFDALMDKNNMHSFVL